jgi:hypothetical protein
MPPRTEEAAPPRRQEQGKRGQEQGKRGQGQRAKPAGDAQRERSRGGRGRSESRREERAPRYANSPVPRSSGDSGGMDFNKPYEPSPSADTAPRPEPTHRKRSSQPVPALFRKKAA